MSALAVCLVALASLAHASWNMIAKRVSAGGVGFAWLYQLVGYLAVTPIGLAMLIVGGVPPAGTWLVVAAGGALFQLAYYLLLQLGYERADLSILYPVSSGLAPSVSVLLAVLILGEHPAFLTLLGVGVVIIGVVVITSGGTPSGSRRTSGARLAARRLGAGMNVKVTGLLFGLLTGTANAVAALWDKQVVSTYAIAPLLFYWGVAAGEVLLLTPYVLRRTCEVRRLWARNRREVLAVGILVPTAYVLGVPVALTKFRSDIAATCGDVEV